MRTFAMRQYAASYWVLVAVFVYTIVLFILPELDSPDAAGFLPILVALGIAIALAAVAVSLWRGAPRRPWLWIVALVPAALFLLMNAIYLPYALTHPADPAFTVAILLVVAVGVLVVTGVVAFREARAGADDRSGRRGRVTSAIVWAAAVGAVATSNVAAGAGSGGASVAEAPTRSALLASENTSFVESSIEMQPGEVLGLFIVNRDGFAHSFDIDALDIHVQLPAHATTAVTVKPTAPGMLEYYCAVPGHREAGMVGSLTVAQ
ncbi:MAG TPA: cupredoxin domain-containing protein [Candidatus Limnocylindrales bacterium]|nr:cupredoxin domain-containing protein [Candidatus Limnocylindrales bacterium]